MPEIQIYGTDGTGLLNRIGVTHTGFSPHITEIVAGNWGGPGFLLYDSEAGRGDIYRVETDGSLSLVRSYDNWRTTWDIIVPGKWDDGTGTDLLFYSKEDGVGEFYGLDDDGEMEWSQRNSGWRDSWDDIIPGNWTRSPYTPTTDLLFFERSTGQADVHSTTASRTGIDFVKRFEFGSGWDIIVPGIFAGERAGGTFTDILLYDRRNGVGEIYSSTGLSAAPLAEDAFFANIDEFVPTERYEGWRNSWDFILPGFFAADSGLLPGERATGIDLFFYSSDEGTGEFYNIQLDEDRRFRFLNRSTRYRPTWSLIKPGWWGSSGFTSLLFYDATT